jgi:hypothetical protein
MMQEWPLDRASQDDQPGGLWERASGYPHTEDDQGQWEYDAGPRIHGRTVTLRPSVVIPGTDGPELVRRLRQYGASAPAAAGQPGSLPAPG